MGFGCAPKGTGNSGSGREGMGGGKLSAPDEAVLLMIGGRLFSGPPNSGRGILDTMGTELKIPKVGGTGGGLLIPGIRIGSGP